MEFFNNLSNTTKEIIIRVISWFLSSFLFLNVLPIFMFIIYMRENLIFSYDLFISGLFGINVFFFYGIVFMLLISFSMTSFIFFGVGLFVETKCKDTSKNELPGYCKYQEKKEDTEKDKSKNDIKELRILFYTFLFINISMFTLLWIENSKVIFGILFFVLICAILTLHFSLVVFTRAKISLLSLLILFPISMIILYLGSSKTAEIVSYGLKSFNSAQKEVIISDMNNTPIINGRLLLLSPENIYVLTQENNQTKRTKIINRNNIIIDIKN